MKEYPGRLISILHRKTQSYWGQVLKEYGISSAEYPILMVLVHKEGIMQEEIAKELRIDKSAIARVVQSLLDKGLVEKRKDEIDKRCNSLYLTEKGRASKHPIEQGKKELSEHLLQEVTEEELELFYSILEKMVVRIQE